MATTKLGEKHICFHCEKKFYDFGKSEVVCPSCGADQTSGVAPDPEEDLDAKSEVLEDELEDDEDLDDVEDLEADDAEADVEDDDEDFEDEDLEGIAGLEDEDEFEDDDEDDEYDDDEVDDF